MKYALLIYQAPNYNPKALSPDEHKQVAAEYKAVTATPGATSGPPMGLPANAITVRMKDGQVSTSAGPYAGIDHSVGGFMIFEAESDEEAVALAAKIPAARQGGAIEVRKCEVYW
jgi:hypothetical protein